MSTSARDLLYDLRQDTQRPHPCFLQFISLLQQLLQVSGQILYFHVLLLPHLQNSSLSLSPQRTCVISFRSCPKEQRWSREGLIF